MATVIISGVVQVVTILVAFFTLWLKLKYGDEKVKAVEGKVDHNTALTTEVKDAATKASEHAESCDEERGKILSSLNDHNTRINSLEAQMTVLKASVDKVSANIDSTRHEMRGHLQTITNSLQLLAIKGPPQGDNRE